MRWFRVAVLGLVIFLAEEAESEHETGAKVAFRWAFGALVGPASDRQFVAITRDTTLKAGADANAVVYDDIFYATTILMVAVMRGETEDVKSLLGAGANPHARQNFAGYMGRKWTALEQAIEFNRDKVIPILKAALSKTPKDERMYRF